MVAEVYREDLTPGGPGALNDQHPAQKISGFEPKRLHAVRYDSVRRLGGRLVSITFVKGGEVCVA